MTPSRTIGVSIAVPPPYAEELQAARESLGDPQARAVPAHVTLVPPTVVPDLALPGIEQHLRAVARTARPFPMLLHGTGSFRPVSPVVFVQVAEGISTCEVLQRRVRTGPLAKPLRFPYHPHVTIAHDLPGRVLDRASELLAEYRAEFAVPEFVLYEHEADGVWRPQRTYAFGGGGGGAPPVPSPAGRAGRASAVGAIGASARVR